MSEHNHSNDLAAEVGDLQGRVRAEIAALGRKSRGGGSVWTAVWVFRGRATSPARPYRRLGYDA